MKKRPKIKLFKLLMNLLLVLLMGGIAIQLSAKTSLASQQQATVIKVVDGDTVDVKMAGCRLPLPGNSQACRIQLSCIDTPEASEAPFFEQSKARLQALLPAGKTITIRDTGTNAKERLVGEIFAEGKSVNIQLVREGQAILFCKYLTNCSGSLISYLSAQKVAREEGLGVWNRQKPWAKAIPCSG